MHILKKAIALAIVVCIAMTFFPMAALAATSGDYEYVVVGTGVQITGYNGSGGKVTIPSTIGGKSVTSIAYRAFADCTSLTSVTMPSSMRGLRQSAFADCSNLTSVSMPTGMVSIDPNAFEGCTKLAKITIPSEVTTIGAGAFNRCESMTEISVASANTAYASVSGVLYNKTKTQLLFCPEGKSGSLSIPSGVTTIGDAAFLRSKRLTSITIPKSVTSIADNAFYLGDGLTAINVDSANTKYASASGILYNKAKTTLIRCPEGKSGSVSLASGVTSIGEEAFVSCGKMTGITIPSSVTSIGDFAFDECEKLEKVSIPDSVTSIGEYAFYNCSALAGVVLPANLTSISGVMFGECEKLTSVVIPAGVTSIGASAFNWCGGLKDAYFLGNAPAMGSYVFRFNDSDFKIHYLSEKTGWATPTWNSYPTVAEAIFPPQYTNADVAGYNSVKISWSQVSGAAGYEIYRKTSSTGEYSLLTTISSGATTSHTDSDLTPGKTYYYKVRTCKAGDSETVYSSYSSAVSAKSVPATPTVTAEATGYGTVKVSWSKVSGASGYKVYRATSSSGTYTKVATITSGSTLSYTNTGLTTDKKYYYKVRAYRTVDGTNVYSSYSSVKSATPVAPAKPKVKAASAGYSSVKISWNKISGASGYKVYRATSKTGYYSKIVTVTSGSTVSYTDKSLTTGKTYYYKVRAYRTVSDNKAYSSYSEIQSAKPTPAVPSGVKAAKASSTSIKVSWSSVSGASGYEVYRATSKTGTYTKVTTTTSKSFTNTGRTKGKTYYYKVRAYRTVSGKKVYGSYSSVVYYKL